MPAAAPPSAPSSPQGGVTIVESGPPQPPPPPKSAIQVSTMAPPATPAPAPSKGTAMDRLRQDLAKRAKGGAEPESPKPDKPQTQTPPAKAADQTPPDEPGDQEPPGSAEPEAEPGLSETPAPPAQPETKPGKVSPWKLVEQYKGRIANLEKEVADAKSANLPEQQKKEFLTQLEQLQKRNEELENEMRFVNYSKSKEFVRDYQKPYEEAWATAMSELSEIPLTDLTSGEKRAATADDLLQLVQMPLGKAREIAEEVFGNFADDVMAHRKTIRALFEAQSKALKQARDQGAEREKMQMELSRKQQAELAESISKTWNKANESIKTDPKHGKWFTPVEGDQDGNQRLAKGYELFDRALNENPGDPNLTPEQRNAIIERHAAVRNRAAAYGRLVKTVERLESQVSELQKELSGYKQSEPPTGDQTSQTQPQGKMSARDTIFAELRKRAR